VLAGSLEYGSTLPELASLVAQVLGDYCFIDVLREDGLVTRAAAADADPDKQAIACELQEFPPLLTLDSDATRVIRSGEPFLCSDISEDAIARSAQSDRHGALLRAFGPHAYMIVPLRARGRTLGLLTIGTHHPQRDLDDRDLQLARELASRAALALDNALLYSHAQEANRLKDEFLATLSHELRTPLNALLGWAQILRTHTANDALAVRAVDSIERNAHAQLVLINDLLDVSRVTSGKLRLEMKAVDIGSVIAAAVDAVRPAARAREIELGVAIAPLRLEVVGDADRLQQIVWNLLSNAVKFTPRRGRVDVTVEESGGAVQIAVRDNGIGIDPAFLPYVFDRFRQADSGTTRAHGGLGLGLAIVHHLVDLHGGSVTVESEGRDCGARFVVTLPGTLHQTEALAASVQAAAAREGALQGVRVMAVDDDPDARELALLVLGAAGADVVAVAGVDDALKAMDRVRPDVIVADIAMPNRDGYDLIREINRRHEPSDRPAMIALSAYASDDDAQRSAQAGFTRHLGKPIDHQTLVDVVAACVPRQEAT
jgi:signal transduction histidine kinase/ActR/RegA family two-component response regulator